MSGSGSEIKIVREDGSILPVNTRGEIYIKGPGLFKDYHNEPDKTNAAFTEDGWFRTDDMGRISEDGRIYIDGRKSNVIISNGIKVVPELMESVLKSYPGVFSVVVVPVKDELFHQVLCVCVQPTEGSTVTEEDVRKFCERIHNDKPGIVTVLPKFYLFMNSFPVTTTGKTSRKDLERIAAERFG